MRDIPSKFDPNEGRTPGDNVFLDILWGSETGTVWQHHSERSINTVRLVTRFANTKNKRGEDTPAEYFATVISAG